MDGQISHVKDKDKDKDKDNDNQGSASPGSRSTSHRIIRGEAPRQQLATSTPYLVIRDPAPPIHHITSRSFQTDKQIDIFVPGQSYDSSISLCQSQFNSILSRL